MEYYDYMYEAENAFGSIDSLLSSFNGMLSSIYESIALALGLTNLSITAISLIVSGIVSLIGLLISVILYILHAYPTYKLAKKMGRKSAILSWVPILDRYFRMYVLTDIVADKDFMLFDGKIRMKNRKLSFWIYLGIHLFGNTLITSIIAVCNIIPGLGQVIGAFTGLLYFLPTIACAFMDYVYLRDVLDAFKPDRKSNRTTSIVVSVIDALLYGDIARTVYLYTLLKLDPLPPEEIYYEPKPQKGSVTFKTL